jgi:hypothetical protein
MISVTATNVTHGKKTFTQGMNGKSVGRNSVRMTAKDKTARKRRKATRKRSATEEVTLILIVAVRSRMYRQKCVVLALGTAKSPRLVFSSR